MSATFDTTGWLKGLDMLAGPLRESLARSAGVAGGKVLRDEAKLLAPKDSGRLASSIYLAFSPERSQGGHIIYSVSWNARTAPHGHLLEFGHWRRYQVRKLANGEWITLKNQPLPEPKWVAAHPFLRPAEAAWPRARAAMVERMRVRLPELLAGAKSEVVEA